MITREDVSTDYYKLLGVDAEAHPSVIRSAYRVMMLELGGHPDRGGSTQGAIRLNRAREILLNPALRKEYDQLRAARKQPPLDRAASQHAPTTGERQPPNTARSTSRPTPNAASSARTPKPTAPPYIICACGAIQHRGVSICDHCGRTLVTKGKPA